MGRRWTPSVALTVGASAAFVSLVGVCVAGFLLVALYRESLVAQIDEAVEDDMIHVSASLDVAPDGRLFLRTPLETPLFDEYGSGWVWQVLVDGRAVAQSGSVGPGERVYAPFGAEGDFVAPGGVAARGVTQTITLPGGKGQARLAVARPLRSVEESVVSFERLAIISFAALGLALILATLVQVRLALRSIRRLTEDVGRMRRGEGMPSNDGWPSELAPLVAELNALQLHNAQLVERGRQQAADLAHALKTPLAVIRGVADDVPPSLQRELTAQVGRASTAIRHHLSRTRSGGSRGQRTLVADAVDDLTFALGRILDERRLTVVNHVEDAVFYGAHTDLEEILGNLIENATKWASAVISVRCAAASRGILLTVDDDGRGIAEADRDAALHRGRRLDETVPGEGMGLAIVADIVVLYDGSLELGRSAEGGLSVRLELPGAIAPPSGATD